MPTQIILCLQLERGRFGEAQLREYKAVVIGGSAGGFAAVGAIFERLPVDFSLPIFLALHINQRVEVDFSMAFGGKTQLKIAEAEEKILPKGGCIYIAPPGYHLLIERDHTLSLSNDELVNWARPSIDVLFESAAVSYQSHLIGILLSGANADGAAGLRTIGENRGLVIVQDPKSAEADTMPLAGLVSARVDHVLKPASIGELLDRLQRKN